MKKILSILLLVFSAQAFSSAMFSQHFNDYSENLEDATDAKKQGIFVFFHMEECPFCQKMRRNVFTQQSVIDYFRQHFLNFELDIESDVMLTDFDGNTLPEKNFAKHHMLVKATPVLAFFDLTGKRVVRHTGFATAKDFLLMGQYMVEKAYEKEPFIRYKRKHR